MRWLLPCVVAIVFLGATCGAINVAAFAPKDYCLLDAYLYVLYMIGAPVQVLVQRATMQGFLQPSQSMVMIAVLALMATPMHALYPRYLGAVATVVGLIGWLTCMLATAAQAT